MRVREHHLPVTRSARYYVLGEVNPEVRQLWFVLHGYGQLGGRFLRHFAGLDDGTRIVVAPEALSRFYQEGASVASHAQTRVGATWMTREDRLAEIGDYVAYLDALHARMLDELDPSGIAIHLLGFSQGAATATRWAALGAARIDRLILWAGLLPDDVDLAADRGRLRSMRLTWVAGDEDEHLSAEQLAVQRERLRLAGIDLRTIAFSGGHRLDEATLLALAGE